MRRSCTSTRPPRKCATPMAMPGDAPTPASLIIDNAFAEAVVDQGTESRHRVLSVGGFGLDDDAQGQGRHQGQKAHDALAVDAAAVLDDPDLGLEVGGELDELHRRSRVHSGAIAYLSFLACDVLCGLRHVRSFLPQSLFPSVPIQFE